MNDNLNRLFKIAKNTSRIIIGLMSGTSLDGLDVALCEISESGENTKVNLLNFETIDYSNDFKIEIRKIFAKKEIDFQHLALLNEYIGNIHAEMILECLKKWNIQTNEVDLIASHGQTVMHVPKILHQQEKFPNATLQIGDGDHIAVKTGIITISDFRQKHLAAGGEGAPLAVYGDYFLFGDKNENRILLNIGGISNFTFLPKSLNPEQVFVTDTGTGNTLIDSFTRLYFPELAYDKNAKLAKKGSINKKLLFELKADDFFKKPFPKTTGPELFSKEYVINAQNLSQTNDLSINDLLATLSQFSVETIADAVNYAVQNSDNPNDDFTIYMSGGGVHNPLLVESLKKILPYKFKKTDDLGISGDAKEAVLFAVLANENVAGGKSDFGTRKGIPSVSLGKISFPK
jgi:anhydro-N-acetylmuramic acid kinase